MLLGELTRVLARCGVLAALVFAHAAVARANDSATGGSGSDLVPLTTSKIRMADEDISLAFEGVPGEGAFEPRKALAAVGLQLPGEPSQSTPAEGVTLYSWFNSASRLRIHGRQYRVEASTTDGGWKGSRVSIVLNDPLTDEEKAKIVEVKSQGGTPAG